MTFGEWCFRVDLQLEKDGRLHRSKDLDIIALKRAYSAGTIPADFAAVSVPVALPISPRPNSPRAPGMIWGILAGAVLGVLAFAFYVSSIDDRNNNPVIPESPPYVPKVEPASAAIRDSMESPGEDHISPVDIFPGIEVREKTLPAAVARFGQPAATSRQVETEDKRILCTWIDSEGDRLTLGFVNGKLIERF